MYKITQSLIAKHHLCVCPQAVTTYEDGKLITVQKPLAGNKSKVTTTTRLINEDGEFEVVSCPHKLILFSPKWLRLAPHLTLRKIAI